MEPARGGPRLYGAVAGAAICFGAAAWCLGAAALGGDVWVLVGVDRLVGIDPTTGAVASGLLLLGLGLGLAVAAVLLYFRGR